MSVRLDRAATPAPTLSPARSGRRARRGGPWWLVAILVVGISLLLLPAGVPAAQAADVRATAVDGSARMVFRWDQPVRYTVEMRGQSLVATFDAAVPPTVAQLPALLPGYVRDVRIGADGRTLTMPLTDAFRLRVFTLGSGVVVDLTDPEVAARAAAPSPPEPTPQPLTPTPAARGETANTDETPGPTTASGPVTVRTGRHEGFQRLVFDWTQPVDHTVETDGRTLSVRFDRATPMDTARLEGVLPPGFAEPRARVMDGTASVFTLTVPTGATARAFRSGPKVVVDVAYDAATARADAAADDDDAEPNADANANANADADADTQEAAAGDATPAAPAGGAAGADPESAASGPAAADDRRAAAPPSPAPDPGADTDTGARGESAAGPDNAPEGDTVADSTAAGDTAAGDVGVPGPIATGGPALTPGAEAAMAERLAAAVRDSDTTPPEEVDAGSGPAVVSLGFSWDKPTASAVFRRGGYLWVVFDRFQEVDLDLLRRAGAGVVRSVEQVRIGPKSTLVRMTTVPGYNPSLRRDGLLWVLDLMRRPLRPERPVAVQPQRTSPVGARVLIPVVEGGAVVPVRDPERGDQFFVLPLMQLGHGVHPARRFPQFALPVTAQGVLVEPFSDRIEMRASRSGAEIRAEGGLILSPEDTRLETLASLGDDTLKTVFDIPGWRRENARGGFNTTLNALRQAVAIAPRSRQGEARLELARFYFANGYAPEALGVLRAISQDQPELINTAAFRALRGATRFLMHRNGEAVDDLGHPSLADVDEAAFWRAAAQARMGHGGLQAAVLEAAGGVLENYPPDLRIPLAMVAADAAIEAGDDLAANTFLEAARDPEHNTTHDTAALHFLEGKLLASTGAFEAAIAAWREAETGHSRRHAALAKRARLDMEYRLNLIDRDGLINGLESLRFAWRGGDFEYGLLKELGALYLEEQQYGDALRTLRLAASYFQERPGAEELTETMRAVFDTLFLEGAANDMPPLTAIALFDEFRELTPTGDRGDEMIRRLADRLVAVDLLDPAAALLERQIRYRLRGLDRSKVGARLALVYLLNRQPNNALEALAKTRFAPLPERLERQRRHLRARGLADTDDPDRAIALLENDPSEDARVLRAEIHWRNRNWPEAARALAELVPAPPAEAGTMDEKDAFRLIDWATALTLAGDETAVSLLRQRYLDALAGTPFRDAFDLVTATPESGVIDIASVGGKIRQAEKFRSYLTAYRDKLRDERLSAIN